MSRGAAGTVTRRRSNISARTGKARRTYTRRARVEPAVAAPTTRARVVKQPVPVDGAVSVSAMEDMSTSTTTDQRKKVDALIAAIRKVHGADAIGRLDEYESIIGTFPTGVPSLDSAIGVGGFPLAKLVQIVGGESVGKSTTVNYLAAIAQRQGIIVYFLDGEMSEGRDRAEQIGVSTELLSISEPETLEHAFQLMATAIAKMATFATPSLIILDSVAALPMKSDQDRAFDELGRNAARASFLSANLGKLVHGLKGTKIGMIFVNQLRDKVRAMPFEKPTYSPGGRALRHWCHLTLEIKRMGQIKQGQTAIGIKSRVRVEKSKLAPPYKSADVDIFFDGRLAEAEGGHGQVGEG